MKSYFSIIVLSFIYFSFMPFSYKFSLCNTDGSVKTDLEKATSVYTKPKGNSNYATYTIAGVRSALRVPVLKAIFRSFTDKESAKINISDNVFLYKLEVDRSKRTYTVPTDGSNSSMMMSINFEQFETFYYKILLSANLQPGEYAFVDKTTTASNGDITVWTFGID